MKSIATTLLAGLMILGTVSAITSPKHPQTNALGFADGGPAPLCLPTDPKCPELIPTAKAKAALRYDGGPAPLCRPTDPKCPELIPTAR